MTNVVKFPGLGIQFTIDRIMFSVGGIRIYWYGFIIAMAFLLAVWYGLRRCEKFGIDKDTIVDMLLIATPVSIIGARTYYVVFNFSEFEGDFWSIFEIWNGGIAIYGAIIFGALTVVVFSKVKKIMVLRLLDAVSPAVMIGQIMGRWGNFFNGEAYGWSEGVEKLPWRMQLEGAYRTEIIDGIKTKISVDFVHPTFLYESLWNLLGFVIINLLYKKKKFSGQVFLMYVTWYGLGRGFIELLRTDSLYIFETIKLNSVIGFITCIAGIVGLVLLYIKSKKESSELKNYKAAYVGGESAEVSDNTEESTVTEPEKKEVEDNGDNT